MIDVVRALLVATGLGAPSDALEVQLAPEFVETRQFQVVLLSADQTEERASIRPVLQPSGLAATFLAPRLPGVVTCRGKGVWCPVVEVATAALAVKLPVFGRASLQPRLLFPSDQPKPIAVLIQGRIGTDRPILFEYRAPLVQDRLSLEIPKVKLLDLRLSAPGYAPVYLLGASTLLATPRIGPLRFVAGSSLSGITLDSGTNQSLPGVEVTLTSSGPVPVRPRRGGSADVGRLDAPRSFTDKRGFFQFTGLSAARYRVEFRSATHPPKFVTTEIPPETEIHLDEILLDNFVQLDVAVIPALDPFEEPWMVSIRTEGSASGEGRASTHASAEGQASFAYITPGLVQIEVGSERGGRFAVLAEEISSDRIVDVRVPIVHVDGRLSRGATPVPKARLVIRCGAGDQVEVRTDHGGRFEAVIRQPNEELGMVMVDVYEEGQESPRSIFHKLRDPVSDPLEMDIDLGTRHLSGLVIDSEDSPVAGAEVSAQSINLTDRLSGKTDEAGLFDLASVPEGTLSIRASHQSRGISPKIEVKVEGETQPPLTLRLEAWRDLEGLLQSSSGAPIGGAEVWLLTEAGQQIVVRSNAMGEFTARVSASATRIVIKVFAPSQVLWAGCIDLSDDGKVTLRLPPLPGGTLSVVTQISEKLPHVPVGAIVEPFLVTENGGFLGLGDLVKWRRLMTGKSGPPMGVPGVAAQSYGMLSKEYDIASLVSAACSGQLGAEATWYSLPPGAELSIEAPAPK